MDPILKAYADCWMKDYSEGMKLRDLDYRDVDWMRLHEWEDIMMQATPHGYNYFHADDVVHAINKAIGPGKAATLRIQAAREGSVACYIQGDINTLAILKDLIGSINADEASIEDCLLRLWWD